MTAAEEGEVSVDWWLRHQTGGVGRVWSCVQAALVPWR